jgi:hypothetical protein
MPPNYSTELFYSGSGHGPRVAEHPTLAEFGHFDNMALIHNPVSSLSAGTPVTLARLQATENMHGLEVTPYKTSREHEANIALLKTVVTPSTVIGVRTGDGALAAIEMAVLELGLKNPIQVIPGGRKNDQAHQLIRRSDFNRPERVLTQGRVRDLRPIDIQLEHADGTIRKFGFVYSSKGVTGYIAKTVNSPEYKERAIHEMPGGTFIAERLLAAKGLIRAKHFKVRQHTNEEPSSMIELIAANGSRMGGGLKPRATLLKPEARIIPVHTRHTGLLVLAALRIGLPIWKSKKLTENEKLTYELSAVDGIFREEDGEHHEFNGPTRITYSISERAVKMLTTRK